MEKEKNIDEEEEETNDDDDGDEIDDDDDNDIEVDDADADADCGKNIDATADDADEAEYGRDNDHGPCYPFVHPSRSSVITSTLLRKGQKHVILHGTCSSGNTCCVLLFLLFFVRLISFA